MAVKLRLRREGKKKQPFYRVVVADVRSPRDGRYIEDIGYYQPLHEPSTISIDGERALYWLRNGAQPSDAVLQLLRVQGIWEEFKPGDRGRERPRPAAAAAAQSAQQKTAPAPEPAAAASPQEEAPAEAVEQAREEVTQPDPLPAEDAGALPEDGPAESGAETPDEEPSS